LQKSQGFTLSQLATLTRQIQLLHELNVGVRALKYKARTGTDLVLSLKSLPAAKNKPKAGGNSRGRAAPVKGVVTAAGFAKRKRVVKRWAATS
jgi:hypothetical protein